jgi:MFS family permease
MLPTFVLSATNLGASDALAGVIATAYVVGRLTGSLIGGAIIARRGASWTAVVALSLMTITAATCGLVGALALLAIAIFAFGVSHSLFHLARLWLVNHLVRAESRARGLTTLAGMWRIGNFIGPALASLVALRWHLGATFVVAAAACAAATLWLIRTGHWDEGRRHVQTEHAAMLPVVRSNVRSIATLGSALALTTAIRSARMVVLPLWGEHLGVSHGVNLAVYAASTAVDAVLFYPAGKVSDRWGRRWSGVPSTGLLTVGFALLPFAGNVGWFMVAGLLMGIGNGWGSGLLMTLGADLAPHKARSVFLGLWMGIGDAGALAGPALVALGALASLPAGILIVGGLGAVSTGMLQVWIPPHRTEHAPGSTSRTPR